MSDLRLSGICPQRRFSVPRRDLALAETTVLLLLLLGLVVLLVPVVLACISLIRWLVPPSQSSHE